MENRRFTGIGPDFYAVREQLLDQYASPRYDADTGDAPEAVDVAVAAILAGDEPYMAQKARIFAHVMERARIHVDPHDWFADHFEGRMLLDKIREDRRRCFGDCELKEAAEVLRRGFATGAFSAELDLGHASPGWRLLMEYGLCGLRERAVHARASRSDWDADQGAFFDAVETVYSAAVGFVRRLAAQARRMGDKHPDAADRMGKLSACLDGIAAHPPHTLYEALQLSYIMHQLIEFEGVRVRSMGGFDRTFIAFYRADLEEGRLTREDAAELIRFFFMKFFARTRGEDNGKNFYFGGLVKDGGDAANELTALALELFYELEQTDPKFSIKLGTDTPAWLYEQAARCIRDRRNGMVLVNDDIALKALQRHGRDPEDVRDYLLIGCYEPTIEGREISCNMSIKLNLAKPVELALNRGVDPMSGEAIGPDTGDPSGFKGFDDLFDAYKAQLEHQVRAVQGAIKAYELYWPRINPSPLLSGALWDTVLSGRDVSQGGAKYNNTGSMGAGLANAADSLAAARALCWERGEVTPATLASILKADWAGHEALRMRALHRADKWGNNRAGVDDIAREVAAYYGSIVNGVPNNRGGQFTCSLFTLDHNVSLGKRTGALPDGRGAGVYLAKGIGSSVAMDKAGVTALIRSASKLDYCDIPNGSVLDIHLHPSAVAGEAGIAAIVGLVKTYFAKGGFAIQFNILDAEALRDAQDHPERYRNLQVRVCGWNVYFVTLSRLQQEQFIATTMQTLS